MMSEIGERQMTATIGKTALIIGASRGLGYALAAEFYTTVKTAYTLP